jgi:hypothetical protein
MLQTISQTLKARGKRTLRLCGDLWRRLDQRFYYKPRLKWWTDLHWTDEFRPFIERTSRQGTRNLDRRMVLIEMARSTSALAGSTAECGVAGGTGSALICTALASTYRDGAEHLAFDSFQGLPEPAETDRMACGKHHWHRGKLHHHLHETQAKLAPFDFCRIVPGWIPETFAPFANRAFRFVHIDVDLHAPTQASLEFFYPRLVPGGVLLLDDHGFIDCPGARRAALEFFADKPEPLIELPTGHAFCFRSAQAVQQLA